MKILISLLAATTISWTSIAQDDSSLTSSQTETEAIDQPSHHYPEHVYHTVNGIDMPITVALGGTSIYLLTVIYHKPATPPSVIANLNKNDVPAFDRWSAGKYDNNLNTASYYPFYAVMPLPLLLLLDKRIARDKGRVGLLYLEAFAFEGILYSSSVHFADRYRPEAYDNDLPIGSRTSGNLRNSFFAGHVAVVALSTLFISKVYNDYHPHAGIRWLFYGASAAATLGMAYMRIYSGQHFTTDVLVGMGVGTACGLGVPAIHKYRDLKEQKWTLSPAIINNGLGAAFTYKL